MRVLVIDRHPFGSLIDAANLCEFVGRHHTVTYLSFDVLAFPNHGWSETPPPFVRIQNVIRHRRPLVRFWRWFSTCLREARKNYDLVYVYYFPGCSILRSARPGRPLTLDIRSGSVWSSKIKRNFGNLIIQIESRLFRNVAIVSEGLARKLRISEKTDHILPLGSEPYDLPAKTWDAFHLLYVGNFFPQRKLEITIRAFARLHHEKSREIEMTYTLVGGADEKQVAFLKQVAKDAGVGDAVRFPGYVPYQHLVDYLAKSNIGMAYVPITEYFDHQPPTKTFEYLMAGMPVLATGTSENRRLVTESNGIVTGDSEDAVFVGLQQMFLAKDRFDSVKIRRSVEEYTWEKIMLKNCLPYLEGIVRCFEQRSSTDGEIESNAPEVRTTRRKTKVAR